MLQQYSAYFIKFIVQIVLARILLPEEFGIIAEMTAVVIIVEKIADGGLGAALIQKKNAETADFNTVFVSNLCMSIILYLLIFVFAPFIANYYSEPSLVKMLRIYGITVFFTSYNSIQTAQIYKKYELKKYFISSLIAAVTSGAIAIALAYLGFGVWAMVAQSMISWLITVAVLQIQIKWLPKFSFDFNRFKRLFSFSWKVLVSTLCGTILENLYNLSIGKYYSKDTLGYYNRGNLFPSIIVGEVRTAVSTVTFPYLSERQDDKSHLLSSSKRITHICAIVMFPLAAGLAAVSKPLVVLLLTEKWLPAVFFLRLECIFYASLAVSASLGNILKAVGKSGVLMKIELIKLVLTIICIATLHTKAIEILCVARVAVALLMIIYNVFCSGKIVGYGFGELWDDICRPLLLSLVMFVLVYSISFLALPLVVTLLLQIIVGLAAYGGGCYLFMKKDISEIISLFKRSK